MIQKITIGLSVHRPEMIPIMAEQMRKHDTVVLEEPPSPDFGKMLRGDMSIEDYLSTLDLEFPEFNRRMYSLLRKFYNEGKNVLQIEPFLEFLLKIHGFFAEGHTPDDIKKNSIEYLVYLAERNATAALLSFYRTVMNGSFEQVIESVKKFAQKDAERFRLRDSLRAQALTSIFKSYPSAYIEAGLMHYPLWMLLRRQMRQPNRLHLIFLADSALKRFGVKGRLYGPGDQLTLMNIFHPIHKQTERETVLAARSLIYSKIVAKDEFSSDLNNLPNIFNELRCINMVGGLELEDCRRLFPLIRRAVTASAYQVVSKYLADTN